MRAIILAAGTGSRLGERTRYTPKAALVVAGRPLLSWDLAFARAAGATSALVVTGYLHQAADELAGVLGADVLHNPRFADGGNILSLLAAADAGRCDQALLIMNCDHIYAPSIAAIVAETARTATQVTAFIDHDRTLGPDDMKVRLADGHVAAIDKQLEAWDAGYVGVTFVPARRVDEYLYTAANIHRERGDKIHVESVLQRMAGVESAATVDVSGHRWFEIDEPADVAAAEEALTGAAWYPSPRS